MSTNSRCGLSSGASGGFSCLGSKFGDCCSQYVHSPHSYPVYTLMHSPIIGMVIADLHQPTVVLSASLALELAPLQYRPLRFDLLRPYRQQPRQQRRQRLQASYQLAF